jgi:hypothetical protein
MNETDHKVAGELFGVVRTPECTGGHKPTPEDLAELAVLPERKFGDVNVFCAGCGSKDCITREGGEELSRRAGVPVPANWAGKYFQVDQCLFCSRETGFANPELREARSQ